MDENSERDELTKKELDEQDADVLPERAAMSVLDGKGIIDPTPPLPATGFVPPHEPPLD